VESDGWVVIGREVDGVDGWWVDGGLWMAEKKGTNLGAGLQKKRKRKVGGFLGGVRNPQKIFQRFAIELRDKD
jgi:hypothetical protein